MLFHTGSHVRDLRYLIQSWELSFTTSQLSTTPPNAPATSKMRFWKMRRMFFANVGAIAESSCSLTPVLYASRHFCRQ